MKHLFSLSVQFSLLFFVATVSFATTTSLTFPTMSFDGDYYIEGSFEYRDASDNPLDGARFKICKRNGVIAYTNCLTTLVPMNAPATLPQMHCETLALNDMLYMYRENLKNGKTTAFVYPPKPNSDDDLQKATVLEAISNVRRIQDAMVHFTVNEGSLLKAVGGREYLLEQETTIPIENRTETMKNSFKFVADEHNRVVSVELSQVIASMEVPGYSLHFDYDTSHTHPIAIEKRQASFNTFPHQKWTIEKFLSGDEAAKVSLEPQLIKPNTLVVDSRFTPKLVYRTVSNSLLSDKAAFELAAREKAAGAVTKNVDDPRNIPALAPVVRESWMSRFRGIPNWVYFGLIGLVVGILVAARARRRG